MRYLDSSSVRKSAWVASIAVGFSLFEACGSGAPQSETAIGTSSTAFSAKAKRRVVLFLWDGLSPTDLSPDETPNLWKLKESGSYFSDHHSMFPTFTMVNAATFASGAFPDTVGIYDNIVWQPGPVGADSTGKTVDYNQPIELNDYSILRSFNAFYQTLSPINKKHRKSTEQHLLLVQTLFETAQKAGMTTAAIGKTGAAYMQDYAEDGYLVDEKTALPLSLVEELQAAGIAVPKGTPLAYPDGTVTLPASNGDPTKALATKFMADGVTPDPTVGITSPFVGANQYMLDVYLQHILPEKLPELTFIWFRDPDGTQHNYGVGSVAALDGLRSEDRFLGQLQAKLVELGIDAETDIMILSDHGHSNYAGPASLFPLRAIESGKVGAIDSVGSSVSGEVRPADLLTRAGFKAYDGRGCRFHPVLSGIKADGAQVYPTKIDLDGSVCGGPAKAPYNTGRFFVPDPLPPSAVIIAPNGGTDFFHVPSRDPKLVRDVVRFLQSREEFGAIFVSDRYGHISGTLPTSIVRLEGATDGRDPDIVASYAFDENAVINGRKGIEFGTARGFRGGHGSFSPIDVHNVMIGHGPHFRAGFSDPLPTGNIDVAPTAAYILGLALPAAEGRPLLEALTGGRDVSWYKVRSRTITPTHAANDFVMKLPTNPDGFDVDPSATTYSITLELKVLRAKHHDGDRDDDDGRGDEEKAAAQYFDTARAIRK